MSKLKPGDKVRIKRLEEIGDSRLAPGWIDNVMDRWAGMELTVKRISESKTYFTVEECQWSFSLNWIDHSQTPITVPVDPSCIPAGYRAVRVGAPKNGEAAVPLSGIGVYQWEEDQQTKTIRLIVEKIPDPIVLPDWIPAGWWIAKDMDGDFYLHVKKPDLNKWGYSSNDESMYLPKHGDIYKSLPQAYLDLPWKESLMQKTEVKG